MSRNIKISLATSCVLIILFALWNYYMIPHDDTVIKVGFIYVGDGATAYTKNFLDAQEDLEEYFGDRIVTEVKYNIPDGQPIDSYISELVDAGCDIIFGSSFGYGDGMKEAALKYPDVQFCHATGINVQNETDLPNYHTYMGHIYEGRYTAGAVAGMKLQELIQNGTITSDEAVVGYVAAFPYSEVISGYTAFFLGVRSICPEATMKVKYTNTWSSYTYEKECAEKLIQEGCIIISQHSDTKGPAVACEQASLDHPVFLISYNQSMLDVAPTAALTGCRINWLPYEKTAIQAMLDHKDIEKAFSSNVTINGNDAGAGFNEGWIEMLDTNPISVSAEMEMKIQDYIERFSQKGIPVFYGDYTGVDPFDSTDTIDLRNEYHENDNSSAPLFHYVLDDVITIE